jgi:MoaA/NifB/PqqE/SkfB family radical SAM enzyme
MGHIYWRSSVKVSLGKHSRVVTARSLTRGAHYSLRLATYHIRLFIQHITPLKLVNMLGAKAQKWLKRDRVWGMPYRYVIDPLNICNLRCPLCPTGLGILARERGRMSLENFKALIDQIIPYAYLVELYNLGEPFLHPQIFEMIAYASSKRIALRLSTNLNRFNREMAEKTVASGLDAMIVSVDGATQEIYEKYRRGGNLERVLSNIRLLVEEKRKAGSRTPFITLRMLVNRYNEGEINALREIASELDVDAFTIGTLFVDTTDRGQVEEWLPRREELSFYDYSAEKLENVWHCADLWESVTINWDGGLAPCCWLHQKKHDYENAFDRPLKAIWNGDAYVSSRRVFAFGGSKPGPVTTICTVCKGRPLFLKD